MLFNISIGFWLHIPRLNVRSHKCLGCGKHLSPLKTKRCKAHNIKRLEKHKKVVKQ